MKTHSCVLKCLQVAVVTSLLLTSSGLPACRTRSAVSAHLPRRHPGPTLTRPGQAPMPARGLCLRESLERLSSLLSSLLLGRRIHQPPPILMHHHDLVGAILPDRVAISQNVFDPQPDPDDRRSRQRTLTDHSAAEHFDVLCDVSLLPSEPRMRLPYLPATST